MDRYVSGNWVVQDGRSDEFVARWKAFTQWSLDNAAGAEDFMLLQDADRPQHFISIGVWRDHASIAAWRNSTEFAKLLAACRELCTDFHATDFELVARPAPAHAG